MLCNPKNILSQINKNVIYEILTKHDSDGPSGKFEPKNWKYFIFNFYFKLIFTLALKAELKQVYPNWKNTINIGPNTSIGEMERYIADGKILVAVFEEPSWLQLELIHKLHPEKSNFLFVKYNPYEKLGRRVTLSYHKMKTIDEVHHAEIKYTPVFTYKTMLGIGIGVLYLIMEIASNNIGAQETIPIFDSILLIIGGLLIANDVFHLVYRILGGEYSKVETKFKKSMSNRMDSSSALLELEHLMRLQRTIIAKYILDLLKERSISTDNIGYFVDSINTKVNDVSRSLVAEILIHMEEIGVLSINNTNNYEINISEDLFNNKKILDERLYEEFDPDEFTSNLIYRTFDIYKGVVNEALRSVGEKDFIFTEC